MTWEWWQGREEPGFEEWCFSFSLLTTCGGWYYCSQWCALHIRHASIPFAIWMPVPSTRRNVLPMPCDFICTVGYKSQPINYCLGEKNSLSAWAPKILTAGTSKTSATLTSVGGKYTYAVSNHSDLWGCLFAKSNTECGWVVQGSRAACHRTLRQLWRLSIITCLVPFPIKKELLTPSITSHTIK